MYLDKMFFRLRGGRQVFNEKISRKDLIKSRFSYRGGSDKLFVVFSGWGGKLGNNFFIRRKLLKAGFSVLEYEFPEAVLSVNEKFTAGHFNVILEEVVWEICRLKRGFKFSKVNIVGVSIGCVNACMVANLVDVEKLFLILPGNCFAEAVWTGIGTQEIRRSYEERGFSLEDLKKIWSELSPENNIDGLNCEVFVFLSEKDLVILPELGERLIEKIGKVECKVDSWMGHYLGVAWFLVWSGWVLRK